jgi:3-oxosteroid 1-dehydrogenase
MKYVYLPDVEPDDSVVAHRVVDVVVVGSGAAGLAAAVTVADAGAEVVVLEKGKRAGGTTRRSGGLYWIPDNHRMREAGLSDDEESAVAYMARLMFPNRFDPEHVTLGGEPHEVERLHRYYRDAPRAIEALERMGGLTSVMNDLSAEYPHWGRPHLQDYHADLQQPVRLGRIMNAGSGESGEALVQELVAGLRAKGSDVQCLTAVVGLVVADSGRIVGVVADHPDGRQVFWARRGVVFGSGGFAHNVSYARQHLRGELMGTIAFPENTGDFQRLVNQLGVPLKNMNNAWWTEVAVEEHVAEPKSPLAVWLPFGDTMVMVNKYGHRVVNEKAIYNERSQVHFSWDATKREYPNRLLFMLFHHDVTRSEATPFRWPVPAYNEKSRIVMRADSWEELGEVIRRRLARLRKKIGPVELAPDFLEALERTVERFNGFAEKGVDSDFGRHATSRLAWHTPDRSAEEDTSLMAPFPLDGPFYCVIVGLGALDTKGGPEIDEHGRVLDVRGRPVTGLYAAGNASASMNGQAYWSAGATIGPALTFGHLAGLDVVRQEPAEIDAIRAGAE